MTTGHECVITSKTSWFPAIAAAAAVAVSLPRSVARSKAPFGEFVIGGHGKLDHQRGNGRVPAAANLPGPHRIALIAKADKAGASAVVDFLRPLVAKSE